MRLLLFMKAIQGLVAQQVLAAQAAVGTAITTRLPTAMLESMEQPIVERTMAISKVRTEIAVVDVGLAASMAC